MATKKAASKKSSTSKKRTTAKTTRKSVRRTSAPLARKSDDGKDDNGKDGKDGKDAKSAAAGKQSSGDDNAAAAQKAKDIAEPSTVVSDRPAKPAFKSDGKPEADAAAEASAKPGAKKADDEPASKEDRSAPQPVARDNPAAAPDPSVAPASVTNPAEFADLLPPEAIKDWDPESPAAAPGKAPPGDSRSFRRTSDGVEEFVLVYRSGSFLITRAGKVGTMGTWNIVEYPHIGSAANAYAHRGSDYIAQGYRDFY